MNRSKRSPQEKLLFKFIKSSWTNVNIRCGKYRHLQTEEKCKSYKDIKIEFTRKEYENWCLNQIDYILSLNRPSLDRKNKLLNYNLFNIQIVELKHNIAKDKIMFKDGLRCCYSCKLWLKLDDFHYCGSNMTLKKASICKQCENNRKKSQRLKNKQ